MEFGGPEIELRMGPEMILKLDPSERPNSSKTLWIPCVSEHLGSPKGIRFWVHFGLQNEHFETGNPREALGFSKEIEFPMKSRFC